MDARAVHRLLWSCLHLGNSSAHTTQECKRKSVGPLRSAHTTPYQEGIEMQLAAKSRDSVSRSEQELIEKSSATRVSTM